jgi:hypothetical protein
MVEFALILFPLLTVVAGIIWFGIGLNYWLDMQKIANQGARWAAVNNWPPNCPRGSTSCSTTPPACTGNQSGATLQHTLRCQALTTGLQSSVTGAGGGIQVCYPGETTASVEAGDPVRVRINAPFTFFWIDRFQITLRASATMRLEIRPTLITGATGPTCT